MIQSTRRPVAGLILVSALSLSACGGSAGAITKATTPA
jgi:hypothetical protein